MVGFGCGLRVNGASWRHQLRTTPSSPQVWDGTGMTGGGWASSARAAEKADSSRAAASRWSVAGLRMLWREVAARAGERPGLTCLD